MQNAGSLVVLGSINADHILNLQSFPTPGETVTGNHYQVAFGGKGANQAVAAGRSGARALLFFILHVHLSMTYLCHHQVIQPD